MSLSPDLSSLKAIDTRIVELARNIKVLSRLSWPLSTQQRFLSQWERGIAELPEIEYDCSGLTDTRTQLAACVKQLTCFQDPLAEYLRESAESYVILCDLLSAAGTRQMCGFSRALYGAPGDPISSGHVNNLQAAKHFMEVAAEYYRASKLREADYCLPATFMRDQISARLAEVFEQDKVRVEIDPGMASKAAAGATRIRLRADTCFSEYDLEQLLQHEAFVHSLTALNGRAQPLFKTFSLGSPRTTGPQEGLATFSELVTGAIDISRMERIALRVVAIDMALGGADFIEVFRFYLDSGQTPIESFNATMRVYRGAPLTGGHAFTKDVVYLHGLMEVHTFFRWAMQHQRMKLTRHFFAGRMTIPDVINLDPLFEDGTLAPPRYLPPWMERTNGLAGYLAFSVFANRITIKELDQEHDFKSSNYPRSPLTGPIEI